MDIKKLKGEQHMAIREIDGQVIIISAFVTGLVLGVIFVSVPVFVVGSALYSKKCPPADCSQQTFELKQKIKLQEAEIKSLEGYKKAVEWGKK